MPGNITQSQNKVCQIHTGCVPQGAGNLGAHLRILSTIPWKMTSVDARAHHCTSLNALFDILRLLDYYVGRPQGSKPINHFVFPFQFLKIYFLTLHLCSSEIASTADRKILLLPFIK